MSPYSTHTGSDGRPREMFFAEVEPCETCGYFSGGMTRDEEGHVSSIGGSCHRYPPTLDMDGLGFHISVHEDGQGCGEHKPRTEGPAK